MLKLIKAQLEKMCKQSWHVECAYYKNELVGTGRIISDGIATDMICGIGVNPTFQQKAIGTELMNRPLLKYDEQKIIVQLICGKI